jgi:hypothetical protein
MLTPKRPGGVLAFLLAGAVGLACSAATAPRGSSGGSGGEDPGDTGGEGGSGGKAGSGGSGGGRGGTGGGNGGPGGSGGAAGSGGNGGVTGGNGGAGGSGAPDAAAAPDSGGSVADAAQTPLPPGVRKVVILHDTAAGGSAGDPSRTSMVNTLNSMKDSHGVVVEMMDSLTKASALMDKALVIMGPNARMFGDSHPDPGLKTLPVPLMVSKDGNTTEIGLGRVSATDPPNYDRITIIKADHPLAAGFPMGNLVVMTTANRQRMILFSDVGPGAIKIATGPQNATSWSLIAYDKDADMGNGLKAPAKRVGFFWHRPAGTNEAGTKLFKAAVDWLLKP